MKTNASSTRSKKDWIAPEITGIHINGNGGGGPDFASELPVGS